MTIFSVMRRPKWIWALVLALFIAAVFAALGQWQLSRAVTSNGPNPNATTEVVEPLTQVSTPGQPVLENQDGQMVTVTGSLIAPDFSLVSSRLNGGQLGYWVIGRFDLDAAPSFAPEASPSPSVAVALGWTADREQAESVAAQLNGQFFPPQNIVGRYVGTDGPVVADAQGKTAEEYIPSTMAISSIINTWQGFDESTPVFGGYVVAQTPVDGLTAIDSPIPQRTTELNWLNIFYAIEWVIFAGFAIFFWYRLVKDAFEREQEESELEEAFSAPSSKS